MATPRPVAPKRKQSAFQKEGSKWIAGGGFSDNPDVHRVIDPAGLADAYMGGEYEEPDYGYLDDENDRLYDEIDKLVPRDYQQQDYLGDFVPQRIDQGPSAMGAVQTDPKLREYQLQALQDLQERSSEGLTAQDKVNLNQTTGAVNRANAGRVGAIKQNMAERGMSGSGMELALQMQNAQAGTTQEADRALEVAAQSQNNQRAATRELGGMASQQRGQEFDEQASKAQANDAINRFNTQNAVQNQNAAGMRNANTRQNVSSDNAVAKNAFNQANFANRANATAARINRNTNMINETKQDYQNKVNDNNKKQGQALGKVSSIFSAVGSMFSDENQKHDIEKLSDDEIEEFLDSLMPRKFRYNDPSHGEGQRVGVMAQDLERSRVGRDLVKEGAEGKELDIANVIGALLDAVGHLHKKVG